MQTRNTFGRIRSLVVRSSQGRLYTTKGRTSTVELHASGFKSEECFHGRHSFGSTKTFEGSCICRDEPQPIVHKFPLFYDDDFLREDRASKRMTRKQTVSRGYQTPPRLRMRPVGRHGNIPARPTKEQLPDSSIAITLPTSACPASFLAIAVKENRPPSVVSNDHLHGSLHERRERERESRKLRMGQPAQPNGVMFSHQVNNKRAEWCGFQS